MVARKVLLQLARLLGDNAFVDRFGPPQTAEPDLDELRALVGERLDDLARALVEEAAASDDVTDVASAEAYLDDRLRTLGEVIDAEPAERIRAAFRDATSRW